MTSPSVIRKYAEKFGVEFSAEKIGHSYSVECWSPEGKRWSATGTHFYSLEGDGYHTKVNWDDTLNELKSTIQYGFEDCDDTECDVCHPGE